LTEINVQEFRPAFAEASLLLKEGKTPILIAKVDGDAHKELAQEFRVSSFPTTFLFENGKLQAEFPNEDPTAAGVTSWVERVLNGSSVELSSVEQFTKLERDLQTAAVVGYFKNGVGGTEYTAFRKCKYLIHLFCS
jgi:thioredoxin-like negative regulator of GroEL